MPPRAGTMRWLFAGTALAALCLQPDPSSAQAVVRRAGPFRNASPEVNAPPKVPAPSATPAPPRQSQETPARQSQQDIGRTDLFLAAPGTYAPRFDRVVPHRHSSSLAIDRRAPRGFALGFPYSSGTFVSSAPYAAAAAPSDRYERRQMPIGVVRLQITRVTEHAPAVAATPVPGKPKTFYVIPGCYAGDRRPEKSRLPVNCDARKIRIVPPA